MKIKYIQGVERKISAGKVEYTLTHIIADDGSEGTGFGEDYKVGQEVEHFMHKGNLKFRLKGSRAGDKPRNSKVVKE